MRHLPTNGGGPALTALLGNNSQVLASSVSACLSQIKAGKAARRWPRSAAQRSKALPDVPTMKEIGYDVEYYLWVGMFAPKGTPADVIDQSARRCRARPRMPTSSRRRSTISAQELAYMDQPEFAKFWDGRRQAHRSRRAGDRQGRGLINAAASCRHLHALSA